MRLPCKGRGIAALLGVALLMASAAATAEVRIAESEQRYLLDASTFSALRDQLATRRAQLRVDTAASSHGLTRAEIQTKYELDVRRDGRCELRQLRVQLNLSLTLPEWRPRARAEPGLRARAARMLRGLAVHEAGHRRNAITAAVAIERALAALPTAADCTQGRHAAELRLQREMVRHASREMRYDQATRGGRRQGALLDVPERSKSARGRLRLTRSMSR